MTQLDEYENGSAQGESGAAAPHALVELSAKLTTELELKLQELRRLQSAPILPPRRQQQASSIQTHRRHLRNLRLHGAGVVRQDGFVGMRSYDSTRT